MNNDENILSDKKLINYLEESEIEIIAELFSAGKFNEIINTFFKKKKSKNNAINSQTIQQFFNEDVNNTGKTQEELNNNKNYDNSNSNSSNNLNFISNSNAFIDKDDYEITKRLTFQGKVGNIDFLLNTLPNSNNNIINLQMEEIKENNISNPSMKSLSNDIIIDYFSSFQEEKEYNFILLEKCNNDILSQQILLTIVIYCLIKMKEYEEIKSLLMKYNIPTNKTIFSLILLKAQFYFKTKAINKSLDLYTEAINNYTNFKLKNISNDIIYIETFKQEFIYFNNLFNYLFALNNIDSKIKKLYYEQKFCLYFLNFHSQGFELLMELYNKYPNDVQIQFEIAKDSVLLSKYDTFQEIFEVLKKSREEESDENKKMIYTNYLLYIKGLYYLALGKVEETENSFTEILKNDSTNVVVMNNNSLLAIYKNNSKESLKNLNLIKDPVQMNSFNETIQENINILKEKFNAHLQK